MKRRYQLSLFALCVGLFAATNSFSQAAWTWGIKPIGMASTGFANNSIAGVSIDDFGNVYVVGTLNDSVTFSGTKVKALTPGLDMYIAKLNSAGAFQWVRTGAGRSPGDKGIDVTTDAAGNAYMLGYFPDSVSFDGTALYPSLSSATVLAKYNSNGVVQWARVAAGLAVATVGGLAYSPTGHLYTGNSVTFSKYTLNGDSVWTVQVAMDSGQILIYDVEVAPTGNYIYYTGFVKGAVNIAGAHLSSGNSSNSDIFIVKFDTDGNVIWAKSAGSPVNNIFFDGGSGLEADHSGNVYLCGQYAGTAFFDADSIVSGGGLWAMFLAKYTSAGDVDWVIGGSGTSGSLSNGVEVRLVENEAAVLFAASFVGNVTFDDSTYTIPGGDVLLAKVSSSGVTEWVKRSGSTVASITPNGMDVNRTTDALVLVGHHTNFPATFTPLPAFPTPPVGVADGFIVGGTTDSPTPVKEKPSDLLPAGFALSQNYPNPFNPSTTIEYQVPIRSQVKVTVFNILGEEVKTLVNEVQSSGAYTVEWDGLNTAGKRASTGVYLYRINAGDVHETKKMLLVK